MIQTSLINKWNINILMSINTIAEEDAILKRIIIKNTSYNDSFSIVTESTLMTPETDSNIVLLRD